jgi:hypothetical protein
MVRNYNDPVVVVRYVALVALVGWLGALVAHVAGPLLRQPDCVAAACAAVILACLLVMKFVGPPPRAFIPRLAIVLAMLAVSVYGSLAPAAGRAAPRTLSIVELVLGAALLAWYARE